MMESTYRSVLYCKSLTRWERFTTRVVSIGNVPLGGDNPVRLQSMTTTDTMDTLATVEQSIRMIEAGSEYVRITAPSINEAENLRNIRDELRKRGYETPLIADIHFTPNAAEIAARIVEKVRVNPGNYADKKRFQHIDYDDSTYDEELDRIRKRFTPLVRICKEYGTAMRIGTNHGSLSDRIMSRYGDTPLGMVESAFEFLRICEDENYHDVVLSMKASNTRVMVQAYRLLVSRMKEAGWNYPLHLGVTEAGEGEDGRIKSAVGIGSLMEDGLGDTIRVSLTEEPEFELPVAREIVAKYHDFISHNAVAPLHEDKLPYDPFGYIRRNTYEVMNIGGKNVPVVLCDLSGMPEISSEDLRDCGYLYSKALDKWTVSEQAADYIICKKDPEFELPGTLGVILPYAEWINCKQKSGRYPVLDHIEYAGTGNNITGLHFVNTYSEHVFGEDGEKFKGSLKTDNDVTLILNTTSNHGVADQRRVFIELMNNGISCPVILKRNYKGSGPEAVMLRASSDIGSLLIDGFGDGIMLKASENVSLSELNRLSFGILQASRVRISKTEYISCPSCGRTLFDLQETTARIRARTDHLKGVKIGIMGCIVNGPGEMADADYGYVGSGPGKITLYKGKEVMRKGVDTDEAVDALIDLIREHGDWVDI